MGWRQFHFALLAFLIAAVLPALALAEKRVALVIGNSAYQFAPELKNPRNDADAIAKSLEAISFEVIKGIDLDEAAMRAAIVTFAEKLRTADVALLFYAGHGLQVEGINYLVPVNGQLRNKIDLQFQGVRLDFLLSLMESVDRTSIVLLDACRDNPLAETLARSLGTRSGSVGRGLAKIETGVGTYIGFSTQPGNVALDGDGVNSPFTAALLGNLDKEGLDIESMMRLVRADVMAATKNQQIPWGNSSLVGRGFFFRKSEAKPEAQRQPEAKTTEKQDNSVELAYWGSIEAAGSIAMFEAYLARWPKGSFADIATIRIAELRAAEERRAAKAKAQEPGVAKKQDPAPDKTGQPVKAAEANAMPDSLRFVETSIGGRYSATFTKIGSQTYEASWKHGLVSRFTVNKFDGSGILMSRQDISGAIIAMSGSYDGMLRASGNAAGYCKLSTGVTCNWTMSW